MGQQYNKGFNPELFDEKRPWIYLLQKDIQWHQVQQKVESSALLTPNITPAGWYICPVNMSNLVLPLINIDMKQDIKVNLTAQSIDSLIPEFMEFVQKRQNGDYLPQIKTVSQSVLDQANKFNASRGGNYNWKMSEYINILNYNLEVVSTKISKDTLPSNENISIESIYGMLISLYGENILYACPQLAVLMVTIPLVDGCRVNANKDFVNAPPKIRKMLSLNVVMKKKRNLPVPAELYSKQFDNTEDLSTELKVIMKQIKDEMEEKKQRVCSQKGLHRLRDLIHLLDTKISLKQSKYDVRKEIVSEHLSFNEDYRIHSDKSWEVIFYEGIKQALNRMPTDIGVYNNGTLRDPSKHIVTRFLISQNPELQQYILNSKGEAEKKLEYLASIVRNARKLGYFLSDWQNKLARKWSKLRADVISVIKQQRKINTDSGNEEAKQNAKTKDLIRVPPPLQYCLALDLNPQAHPFSFTYGRSQGYCIEYSESLSWFLNSCNNNEKSYFYSLLENPDCHEQFFFLNEIPKEIRIPPQPFNSNSEQKYIANLDEWLVSQEKQGKQLKVLTHIHKFIDDKINQLPEYLKNKTKAAIKKKVNVIALFDAIFQIYPPEEVYLEKTELPFPVIVDQTEQNNVGQLNSLSADSTFDQQLLGFWGPPKYGGKI